MDTFQSQMYLHLSFGLQLVQPTEFLKIIHAEQLWRPSFHIIRWYFAYSNMAAFVLNIYIFWLFSIPGSCACRYHTVHGPLPPYNRESKTYSHCFCVITHLLDVFHWQLACYVSLLFKWHNIRFCMKWPMAYFSKYILHYNHISAIIDNSVFLFNLYGSYTNFRFNWLGTHSISLAPKFLFLVTSCMGPSFLY